MNMRFTLIFSFALTILISPLSSSEEEQKADLQLAEHELLVNKPLEALRIIARYKESIENNSAFAKEWLALLLRASVDSANIEQLQALYEFNPDIFARSEKASLILADNFLQKNQLQELSSLRNIWRGKERDKSSWVLLDSDYLLLTGNKDEAISLLKNFNFSQEKEGERNFRLAVLNASSDPETALNYLSEVSQQNSQSGEIHSFKGKLYETLGRPKQALREYQAATVSEPQSAFFRDQLAEFYVENNRYPLAIAAWEQAARSEPLDFLFTKLFFWKKVTSPSTESLNSAPIAQGYLEPYIQYLLSLAPHKFWDERSFEKLSEKESYLQTQETAFWLQTIDALQRQDEKKAENLLSSTDENLYTWSPTLYQLLKSILHFRSNGTWIEVTQQSLNSSNHPFLNSLIELKSADVPFHVAAVLQNPNIFSATFLAAGWKEAALDLADVESFNHERLPKWLITELTEALWENRGSAAALSFAKQQTAFPELSLMIAELLIAEGNTSGGQQLLEQLVRQHNSASLQAASILVNQYMEQGRIKDAKVLISKEKELSQSISGKEILARVALQEGDEAQASQIYNAIVEDSAEAKSFLAKQAYLNKDWPKAIKLTEQLIEIYPDNKTLYDNLQKIKKLQSKKF